MLRKPVLKKSKPKKPDPNQKTNELLQLILDEVSAIGDRLAKEEPEDLPPDEAA